MKNKLFSIIGALLFVAAVVVGNFCDFKAANIVEVALAAFALLSVIIGTIKAQKDAGTFTWKTILILALAIIGGALVAVGGGSSNIFEELAGLAIAIISVIVGLVFKPAAKEIN